MSGRLCTMASCGKEKQRMGSGRKDRWMNGCSEVAGVRDRGGNESAEEGQLGQLPALNPSIPHFSSSCSLLPALYPSMPHFPWFALSA